MEWWQLWLVMVSTYFLGLILGYLSYKWFVNSKKHRDLVEDLQKYTNIEKRIGCPIEVIEHLINGIEIFYEDGNEVYTIYDYYIKNNVIVFVEGIDEKSSYNVKFSIVPIEVPFTKYKKLFWLRKDKRE